MDYGKASKAENRVPQIGYFLPAFMGSKKTLYLVMYLLPNIAVVETLAAKAGE